MNLSKKTNTTRNNNKQTFNILNADYKSKSSKKSLSAFMLPHKELSAIIHTTHNSLTSNTLRGKFFITLGEPIPHVCFHVVKFWKCKMSSTCNISVFRNSNLLYLPFK